MDQDQKLLSARFPQTSNTIAHHLSATSPHSQVSWAIHTTLLAHSRLQKVSDQVPGTPARIQGACSLSLKGKPQGHLDGSVGQASAFGSVHDPRVPGPSPTLGSLLGEGAASPSPSPCCSAYLWSLSNSLSNK